jgi:aerobic carbon-monoxide dehydrogenase medium subunit
MMKQRLVNPDALISIGSIPGLDRLAFDSMALHLGALCRHQRIATSPEIGARVPLLTECFRHVATPRVRNVATARGALVHADPNQDPPVSLLALDAHVRLSSLAGDRTITLEDFLVDYYETSIREGEILTQITVPLPPANAGSAYVKFLPRTADDYATESAAAILAIEDGRISDARLALGSLGSTALRCHDAEKMLRGQTPDVELFREAAETVRGLVDPISDGRGSANYKRAMAPVFARRALQCAHERATGTAQ